MKYSFKAMKRKRVIEKVVAELKKVQWRYQNSIMLIISILFGFFLLKTRYLENLLENLKDFGYLGSFSAGIFYAFSLTAAPATVVFYTVSKKFNPFLAAGIGAFGSLIGDYLIFRFVSTNLMREMEIIWEKINGTSYYFKNSIFYHIFPFSNLIFSRDFKIMTIKISRSKIYMIFIKILSFFIIASPLPDEIAVTLLGVTKEKPKEFVVLSYLGNFLGIFCIYFLSNI